MGIHDEIGDSVFNAGMLADAESLGDKGTKSSGTFDPAWIPEFKAEIHGLILVTGDNRTTVEESLTEIKNIFSLGKENATIHQVLRLVGDVRPGALSAHEQFVPCPLTQNSSSTDHLIVASASVMASHSL
jgi:hypothetical protein